MDLQKRIDAFENLGIKLKDLISNQLELNEMCRLAGSNEWFTPPSVSFALNSLIEQLRRDNLQKWIEQYPQLLHRNSSRRIGIVTAGNIPLVGFHDLLCVLISGNELVVKISSKDEKLMKAIIKLLIDVNHEFESLIRFENDQLKDFDAIIATGSDNTAKYFEYYFGKYPNIIRKNRNSVSVLSGEETNEELELLADDILLYFGLGCRNVSKLYIPEAFDIQRIFKSVYKYNHYVDHNKYANNYTYNKSIYLMNKVPFWENGFMMMKEDIGLASPISVVYFEKYGNIELVKERLAIDKLRTQCVVASEGLIEDSIPFGKAQKPELWDYADDVDTMKFLLELGN